MSLELRRRLFQELDALVLIDPHTHINALDPASRTLADILGYHYYTELAHSAGMPKDQIEEPGLDPREKVRRLLQNLGPIENTIQYSWLGEMAEALFEFPASQISGDNWEAFYDAAEAKMAQADWADAVLRRSKLEGVFLTNDFDDSLSGFDTQFYIPCLRTDDLVFHLAKPEVRNRLETATGVSVDGARSLVDAVGQLFEHFTRNNARACAISLPPDFSPAAISAGRAETAIAGLLRNGTAASESDRRAASQFVFWTLAQYCDEYRLPFDLMIGVNRGVYADGVHQGRDLYDSRVSLIQYKSLFNAFPEVTFPVSVLASVTNQELASYAWIFPNVVTNGHWWYSNTPTFIEHDLAARLEAVPRTKQIGYYSDMYKLEFALPKFAMYKRILAKVLAQRYVEDRGWSEERAIELGKQLLRGNVETIFGFTGPKAGVLGVSKRMAEISSSSGVLDEYIPYAPPVPVSVAAAAAAAATQAESEAAGGSNVLGELFPAPIAPAEAATAVEPLEELAVEPLETSDEPLELLTMETEETAAPEAVESSAAPIEPSPETPPAGDDPDPLDFLKFK